MGPRLRLRRSRPSRAPQPDGARQANGAGLELRVEDDGTGLPDTANLFVPFYTTKPGGSGVGLALSRQIAESHGGSLQLENRADGTGAVASLRLPI